jgi:uncharacterized protein (TIGR02594 family)
MKKIFLIVLSLFFCLGSPVYAKTHHKKKVHSESIVKNDDTFYAFNSHPIEEPKHNRKHVVLFESGGDNLVVKARQYLGKNAQQLRLPNSLWCADFMNKLVGGSDRRAISYLHRGSPASYGCTNCVAVTKRKGGAHVGIVADYDKKGNPILISGNHGHKVGFGVYPKRNIIAFRYI